ncbi:hypothetical protein PF002_g20961 [Phytophthora fragariae]|uniref:Uncharacterized protein n=1 Tax=Phytophthora fragariae TaxID=53985 RepID=A0A6A3XLH1_9STRA|nr:hypothetical protein PF009_g24762 [Phytophthora fragariae]KAE9088118.1 hypothetical protein PF007_g20099 [Phytophthora fragariae]KAE9117957.1 hypothetical protein PF006_g18704 [Phytophthora fragariae]KAE9203333.1 hypothetical protein PF002_g20961 [Phytophthora fragariae]KAE9284856.1 hypothetical protein PF001_g22177 [Phytophthora fragariae]
MLVAPPALSEWVPNRAGFAPVVRAAHLIVLATRAAVTHSSSPRLLMNTAAGMSSGNPRQACARSRAPKTGHR